MAAGIVLAGRYRIVTLLGRGAMGEVYRADDLTLGQPVALKLLGTELARNPAHQIRLTDEVKVARRVSHPHVCRVHDIGASDGRPFLTMELVDGEDLAALLRRIGRLPHGKALAISKQLCGALRAAHESGVLHRDLKPANVMLDAEGDAHITDFGIAALAVDAASSGAIGTPLYMAPELLTGAPATVQSDIFALGLVMYEMFTGRPAYRATSMTELVERHRRPIEPPSEVAADVDPEIEKTILRCLARDPKDRPRSVLDVLLHLPGGDPLAAALAAGETPSPELVAAALSREPRNARLISLGVAAIAACLALAFWLAPRTTMAPRVPLPHPADAMVFQAQKHIQDLGYATTGHLGYGTTARETAHGFDLYEQYLLEIAAQDPSPKRWARLANARPAAIDFWYRQSPTPLIAVGDQITWFDPPAADPGMVQVRLDPLGRLRELLVVPAALQRIVDVAPPDGAEAAPREPDWRPLFAAAELPFDAFAPVAPLRVPQSFADVRRAWLGVYPENPGIAVRVEVASLEGRPVAFRIIEDRWVKASITESLGSGTTPAKPYTRGYTFPNTTVGSLLNGLILIGAVVLAWTNVRRRRIDLRGAARSAGFVAALAFASTLLRSHHSATLGGEMRLLGTALASNLILGLRFGLFYIAVEPHVRRIWPETLVAWTRLLRGQWRDTWVGVNVVTGALSGAFCVCLRMFSQMTPELLGEPPAMPLYNPVLGPETLLGARFLAGVLCEMVVEAHFLALGFLLGLVLLRLLIPHRWLAAIVYGVLVTTAWSLLAEGTVLSWLLHALIMATCTFGLVRFGLLGLIVGATFYFVLMTHPLTLDPGRWYFGATMSALAVTLGLTAFGAWAATNALHRRYGAAARG